MSMRPIILFFFTLGILACKTGPEVSDTLKKASQFQQEGLVKAHELEKTIQRLPMDKQGQMEEKRALLRDQMIDIPGIPHDHKYCNGKHNTLKVDVTDDEMLSIQKEWRDSIFSLSKRIMRLEQ